MQPQPTSVMLTADAYLHELLADAERVRPVPPTGAVGRGGPAPLSRWRRTIGLALVWSGERVLGGDGSGLVGEHCRGSHRRRPRVLQVSGPLPAHRCQATRRV